MELDVTVQRAQLFAVVYLRGLRLRWLRRGGAVWGQPLARKAPVDSLFFFFFKSITVRLGVHNPM